MQEHSLSRYAVAILCTTDKNVHSFFATVCPSAHFSLSLSSE